jgi:hypothetical protein
VHCIVCTCSGSYGGGGLLGRYYTDTRITATAAYTSRVDAGINFKWGIGAIGPTLATDKAAVRYAVGQMFMQYAAHAVVGSVACLYNSPLNQAEDTSYKPRCDVLALARSSLRCAT